MSEWERATDSDVFRVANAAGVSWGGDVGRGWIRDVLDSVRERVAWAVEHGDAVGADWLDEIVHEVCDAAPPVYHWELWQVFTDLAAWQYAADEVAEYGADVTGDMCGQAARVLYYVASLLVAEDLRAAGWDR